MPVAAVVDAAQPLGRPRHHVRDVASDLLLAARAQVAAVRVAALHPAHEPRTVGMPLTPLDAAEGAPDVQLGPLAATTVGPGHASIIAGRWGPTSGRGPTALVRADERS